MTNADVHPAASEPNSIAPMALDTNQWKIDLNDLHSGDMRLDFSVRTFDDDEEPEITGLAIGAAGRTAHTGRRALGVMTAMLLVVGLGFAALRGRPALQRAYASARSSSAKPTVVAVTAVQAAQAAPAPSPVIVAAPAPAPSPAPVAKDTVPTMSANALPNAPKAKRVRGPAPKKAPK